jgi:cytochrome c553
VRANPLILLSFLALPASASDSPEAIAFFESKVRPLLVEHCLDCHSPEHKVKGGLRLDTREGWMQGGDSGAAIVPGKPDDSLLISAVRYTNKDLRMPEKRKLPAAQIAILEEWVRMGAPDPRTGGAVAKKQTGMSVEDGRKFWSYVPPKKPVAPAVKDTAWPRGDIDRFILAKIEERGLKPVADASAAALARRLYFTLTGMPPSPEQIASFAHADLAKVTDELLATPQFGENFARHWLDVARFAESSGGGRTLLFKDAWRYRDYVIESFNRDVPYDRFLREQIAGDLLPAPSVDEKRRLISATAFLALGPTNYEEQDKQQLRFDVIDEQLDTIGKGILGQTIGCARCHDHKFDPISQRDYYAMAGIMASTRTLFNYTDNVARWIDTPLPIDAATEEALRAREAKMAALKEQIAALKKETKEVKEPRNQLRAGMAVAIAEVPGIVVDDNDAKAIGEWTRSQKTRTFIGDGYLHDDNGGKGEKTLTFTPKFPAAGYYEVRLAYSSADGRSDRVPVHIFHANGEETVFVDQTKTPPVDGRFVSLGRFRFEKDGAGYVLVSNEGTKGHVTADAVQFLPETEAAAVATTDTAAPGKNEQMKAMEKELKALAAAGPKRPLAMSVLDDEKPADTHIRIRGLVAQKGALVPRGVLTVASSQQPAMPADSSGRREMADWLASPENPLTARVYVNRVWHWLFGTGIVRSMDNFGTTGDAPTHPELLDFLATQFVEQGWSTKKLVREIILSRTWQLASASPLAADPDNRLFTHHPRRRLDAEQLRDAILATSGELRLDVLGPNIAGAGEIDANDTSAQNIE